MKQYFYAFSMCQSMFCALPFPCHVWDEKARSKMLLFLPVIGLEIGFFWGLFGWLSGVFHLSPILKALGLTVLPFLLTGFIHLDGFMDVTDAVGSCRDLARRREILKDSHVGSFAVIGLVLLMLSQFALFLSVKADINLWTLVFVPAISRTSAGIAVLTLPKMSGSQYSNQSVRKGQVLFMVLVLLCLVALDLWIFKTPGLSGLFCAVICGLSILKGYRSLEGMNGDISGYSITLGELSAAALLAFL